MLLFLATVLERLDLALDHVSKRDVHNARFGLMLTDNAVELVLHQIAKDKARKLKSYAHLREQFPHSAALEKALGRSFDEVKFAKLQGTLTDEVAQTITTMHEFRNEVYHVGLQHEEIQPALSAFYFEVACHFVGTYAPNGLGWGSNQKLPERSKKYFKGDGFMPGSQEDFPKGCMLLAQAVGHDAASTIATLSDQMNQVVHEQDTYLDIIAGGVYKNQQTTRDKAVIDSQVWPLAFTDEGKAFAKERNFNGSVRDYIQWLAAEYPLTFRKDPIPSWHKRAESLRLEKNVHAALGKYQNFMTKTAALREALMDSSGQVEAEIDAAIDRARGK